MFNRIRIKKMNIMRYPITVSRLVTLVTVALLLDAGLTLQ